MRDRITLRYFSNEVPVAKRKSIAYIILLSFFGAIPIFTLYTAAAGILLVYVAYFLTVTHAWASITLPFAWSLIKLTLYATIAGGVSLYAFQKGLRELSAKELSIIGYGHMIIASCMGFVAGWGSTLTEREIALCIVIALTCGAFGIAEVIRSRQKRGSQS